MRIAPVVVTGVLMLAGAMVPFRLIPALLARPDAERGTWRRFLTSPGVLCFGALSPVPGAVLFDLKGWSVLW